MNEGRSETARTDKEQPRSQSGSLLVTFIGGALLGGAGATLGGIPGTLGDSTNLGASLASVGDLNGDGVPELLAGANGLGQGDGSPGHAVLFNGADHTVMHTFSGEETYSIFGTSVAAAGSAS